MNGDEGKTDGRARRAQRGVRPEGVAEGFAAAVRRRQRERGPRVLVYDADRSGRLIGPSQPGYDELIEVAERLLALAPAPEGQRRKR